MSQEDTAPAEQTPAETEKGEEKAETAETKTFDAEYVKQLRSENAARRTEAQQLKERLEELEERDKSEVEKATGKAAKAEQRAAEAEAKLLRYEVAAEKQVPADAMDLLTGKSREELEAQADKVLGLVKNRTDNEPTPDFDGGAREPASDKTPEAQINEISLGLLGVQSTNT